MKLTETKGKRRLAETYVILEMSSKEAAGMIRGLAAQLEMNRPNGVGRLEVRLDDGRWFTAFVVPE